MKKSRLSELQSQILETVAVIRPRFTLVGGGALSGVHLGHRETRDLDLFWRDRSELGEIPERMLALLRSHFRDVDVLQRDPSFMRIRVSDGAEVVLVDLALKQAHFERKWAYGDVAPDTRRTSTPRLSGSFSNISYASSYAPMFG